MKSTPPKIFRILPYVTFPGSAFGPAGAILQIGVYWGLFIGWLIWG